MKNLLFLVRDSYAWIPYCGKQNHFGSINRTETLEKLVSSTFQTLSKLTEFKQNLRGRGAGKGIKGTNVAEILNRNIERFHMIHVMVIIISV